jgi:CubicO group peptidase (beta-lactamase class C family)
MDQRETTWLRKIISLMIAILTVVLSVARVQPAFAQVAPVNFDAVDAYISAKMEELGIPGAALVIVQDDQIVHLKAFGVADGSGRLVTPQTPFFTGSTGKSITALAIMQLVEAGKIKLDAPVQTYLPWFRVADANASQNITVRHLLNMMSGIPRSIGQEQLANTDLNDSAIENNVRALAKIELIAPPGEQFEYSNANYVTLGMIIQAVTGQSYETYIRERIFNPLEMQNSFTSKTEAQQAGLALGYQKWFGIPVASPNLPFARGSLPAGQLILSAEDFGHYLIAQLNNGNYHGVSLLSPASITEMHQPPVNATGVTASYGMGWEVQHFQNVQVFAHDGAVPGFTAVMFLVPEKNMALAMVMNTYNPIYGLRVSRLPSNILRMLLDQDTIQVNEILFRQIIYVLVMLIPFLHFLAVVLTWRRVRSWRRGAPLSPRTQIARFVALPLIWNAALAYVLLVTLPKAFEVDISTMILIQPDAGWVAVVSGVFAIVWGILRTGIVVQTMRACRIAAPIGTF